MKNEPKGGKVLEDKWWSCSKEEDWSPVEWGKKTNGKMRNTWIWPDQNYGLLFYVGYYRLN